MCATKAPVNCIVSVGTDFEICIFELAMVLLPACGKDDQRVTGQIVKKKNEMRII